MAFTPGATVGAYRIVEQLGQGGMATVYKAYHPSLDRYVAIKVMHPAFSDDPTFLARFQREARVVARLEHPNIVPIYDFSEQDGQPYLVMKYVEGVTLKAYLAAKKYSPAELIPIVESVGNALAYAHVQNIVHRDVKPSNVLITPAGQVYLTDFGLARMAQSGESTLTHDQMIGTPQYISPEQAMSKPDLDYRTDIYSFGVMLYEMVVGRVPYNADTPFAVIHDHIYTPLPMPRQVNPDVSVAMERVLLKALAKDPADRYTDIPALVAAYRQALDNGIPAAVAVETPTLSLDETLADLDIPSEQPAAPVRSTGKNARKATGWIIAGVALIFIVLAGVLLAGAVRRNQAAQSTQTAQAKMAEEQTLEAQTQAANQATRDAQAGGTAGQQTQSILDGMVGAWQNGDYQSAREKLPMLVNLIAEDRVLFESAIRYLVEKNAAALAIELLFSSDRPVSEFVGDQVYLAHEIIYRAAGDPNARNFYLEHKENPLFLVGYLRNELYFGEASTVKEQVGNILSNDVQSRRFPEVRLLEVEIYLVSDDATNARIKLNQILNDTSLPDWVLKVATELDQKVPK